MAEDGRRDLQGATGLLEQLGLPASAQAVASMLADVERGKALDGNHLRAFLSVLRKESTELRPAATPAIKELDWVMMAALGQRRSRRALGMARIGRTAPSMERAVQRIDRAFPPIHDALERLAKSRNRSATLLVALFGHAIRWQILEDAVQEWVDHWGEELSDTQRQAATQVLTTISYADSGVTGSVVAPVYRRAIVHGDFEVGPDGFVQFWSTDQLGRTQPLAPMGAAAILALYNSSEMHLRTFEAYARVMRAWSQCAAQGNDVGA